MIQLALRYGEGPVMMDTISSCVGVSRKYLYNLLTVLKTTGLVRAVRGAGGGFELTRKPSEITANDVVQTLEGSLSMVHCVDDTEACDRVDTCAAREVWEELGATLQKVLSAFTLEQLAERQHSKCSEPLMFHI